MGGGFSKLKRPRYPMPDFVRRALDESGLMEAYQERPAYQQNDYVGWINRAKRQETKEKRLRQMLEELETGGVYMKIETLGIDLKVLLLLCYAVNQGFHFAKSGYRKNSLKSTLRGCVRLKD